MASGIADYQKIIRPRYGAAQESHGNKVILAGVTESLVTVSGKGVIYGGPVHILGVATQVWGRVHLIVDGEWINPLPLYYMNKFGYTVEHSTPVYLLKFDDVAFEYGLAFSEGITFESSVEILYEAGPAGSVSIYAYLIYALI